MVAPNGARLGKADHPALPLAINEIAQTAAECAKAGAGAIHAHARDSAGMHSLDVGLCGELLAALQERAPNLRAQISSESAGVYSPARQRGFLRELRPAYASAAVAELRADNNAQDCARLYAWAAEAGVALQHIVYSAAELALLARLLEAGDIPPPTPAAPLLVLFVLGRYAPPAAGAPQMLPPFLRAFAALPSPKQFMVCAFGGEETACLLAAAAADGDCRVGFENNRLANNGKPAANNAERVAEIAAALAQKAL